MPPLRFGVHQLPAAEVVLVQTLFRLYSHGGTFNWQLVSEPPFDALLVDGTTPAGRSTAVNQLARAVLRLQPMHEANGPDMLQRPIRADHLLNWLTSTEARLLSTEAIEPPAPAAEPAATPAPTAPTAARPAVPGPAAQAVPDSAPASAVTPAPSGPAAAPAAAQAPGHQPRYRLLRWPPATMLRADAHRIRMATLLSRRAFSEGELAEASQQPLADAQAFLRVLLGTGLVAAELPQPQAAPAPAASAAGSAPARPSFARSLISGIRRRLGL